MHFRFRDANVKYNVLAIIIFLFYSCEKNNCCPDKEQDLTHIPYNPKPYKYPRPVNYPIVEYPVDNAPTIEGIELGRRLFYDPILSGDSTQGCFSCHIQTFAFTDGLPVSMGIDGISGSKSAMSLVDIGYHYKGLFWNGRATTLEEQALLPVIDQIELHNTWPEVERRLVRHSEYPTFFRKAFGIKSKNEITKTLVAKAIAQFERNIISSGHSKYDRVVQGLDFLTANEIEGFEMFFDLNPLVPDAECGHCHNSPLFTTTDFFNNGLQSEIGINQFSDNGYGNVTNRSLDNGKFKAPSLRNIFSSAPYMHDGRIQTIEDVIKHYVSGGHPSFNRDPLIFGIHLTEVQQSKLLSFLKTLQDDSLMINKAYSNPF